MAMPSYEIKPYSNCDRLPDEAESMFARQLEHSRKLLPVGPDQVCWSFLCICALTPEGHVLGGVHLDIGPINSGPIAERKLAYLERVFVRPEYRRLGVATAVLRRSIQAAREAGCEYIRCSNNWDNPAETALLRKCGFALVDLNGEDDEEPCYLAVRPVRNLDV